jgi:aspartate/methionine/tyrosine aminotransferase
MHRSGIREIFDRASKLPGAIHLEMGEPNFTTPEHVRAAAAAALEAGFTRYTPNAGIPALRTAAAAKLRRVNGIEADPSQITITVGGVGGLYSSLVALCNPGDEVVVIGPSWPNYRMIATLLGLRLVQVPLFTSRGERPSVDALDAVVTPATRVVLVNSPANPTGQVLTRAELQSLVSWVDERQLWMLSDEVYDEISYDGVADSPYPLSASGSVVSVFSMSKTYAMTGWRIGYVVAPPELAPQIEKTLEPTVSCANAAAQMAAVAALEGPQDCVVEMRDAYRKRRDIAVAQLTAADLGHTRPDGAFYLWIDVSTSGLDSLEFARTLLDRSSVAVTPGVAFGAEYDDHVRVSLASAPSDLAVGIDALIALAVRS